MSTQDEGPACAVVALGRVLAADADIHERGHLKDHPDLILFGISRLDNLIACVRGHAEQEQATWRQGDVILATAYNADAEHHGEVAGFLAHTCDCEWCPQCRHGEVPEPEDDPVGDLVRSIDALGDMDLITFIEQERALASGRFAGVHDALFAVAAMVFAARSPEPSPGLPHG